MSNNLKKVIVSWIEKDDVKKFNIIRSGVIGGCIFIRYIIADDGKMYLIKN